MYRLLILHCISFTEMIPAGASCIKSDVQPSHKLYLNAQSIVPDFLE